MALRFLIVAMMMLCANALVLNVARPRTNACVMMAKKAAPKSKMVTLVLEKDVEGLGEAGALVEVKPAYADNFIISRGLGSRASKETIKKIEEEVALKAEKAMKAKKNADEAKGILQQQFGSKGIDIEVQVGADGTVKDTVTAADVAAALSRAGVAVDAANVDMEDQVELGSVVADLMLHPEVSASIKVTISKSKITFS